MSGKTIAFIIEKGGTGKSTLTFNVGWELSNKEKVLLIDIDGQAANLTYLCGINKDDILTVTDILNGRASLEDAIVNVKENMDILPANNSLVSIGTQEHFDELSQEHDFENGSDYQLYLIKQMQDLIRKASEKYDWCLLDCSPTPNYGHVLTLCATKNGGIIIPVLPDASSIISDEGTAESVQIIKETGINKDLKVLGILFNRDTDRTNLSRQVKPIMDEYAKAMKTTVFKNSIRNSVVLSESSAMHVGVTFYRPKHPASDDVRAVVREIKRRINNGNTDKKSKRDGEKAN